LNVMKWAFTIRNKFKMAIVLLIVFLGLLIKNFVEKRHVSELGTSFSSVYKDRLLVEGYIYQLSNHLHVKKMVTDNCYASVDPREVEQSIGHQNTEIGKLVTAYEKTELTPKEEFHLNRLKEELLALNQLERSYMNRLAYDYDVTALKEEMAVYFARTTNSLHELSEIQLAVGKKMNEHSREILSESSTFSQFGLMVLVVLGLLIQVLIFSSKDTVVRTVRNVRLN